MIRSLSKSLRRKLILLVTAVASITVLIACIGLGAYQWHHARNTLYQEENTAAQMTADSSAAALMFADKTAAMETLSALRNDSRILAACLFDKNGAPAGAYVSSKSFRLQCPEVAPKAGTFTLRRFSILRPVSLKDSRVGSLYFEVSLAELNRFTISLGETALLAATCAMVFAFLLSSVTERWISAPIVHLTRTAVQVANDSSSFIRASKFSNDEVGILVEQFNHMLDRLHGREAEIRSAHDLLETAVQERTKSLQDEIVERKLVELNLVHAKDLAEEANRAKSSFLANMSHELRTPLNAIIGYSEMLYEDAQDASESGMREDLGRILSSARHLLAVISDVLDLSKIEAGHMQVQLDEFAVTSIINDVVPIASVLVKNKQNDFQIENYAPDATNLVDPLRFRQCLLNLLGNAAKFTQNGTITLRTEVREQNDASWVVWSVCDTGIGIAAENLAKLFQSFSQVDDSATRRHGGTGLGLCISQELCKAMNGWIEVESESGVGSAFRIWLPLASAAKLNRQATKAGLNLTKGGELMEFANQE